MRIAVPSFVLITLALSAVAAPVPKAVKKVPDYYPSTVGTKWVYAQEDGTNEHTREVTASTTKDGVTDFTVTWKEDGSTQLWEMKKDATGVYRIKQDRLEFNPPHQLIQPKMETGVEWTSEYAYGEGSKYKFTRTVGKVEKLKTPAGEFDTLPIVSRNLRTDDETTLWYAEGVGLIALQHKDSPKIVLREYTIGK